MKKFGQYILIYLIFRLIDLGIGVVAGKYFTNYYMKKITESFDI